MASASPMPRERNAGSTVSGPSSIMSTAAPSAGRTSTGVMMLEPTSSVPTCATNDSA